MQATTSTSPWSGGRRFFLDISSYRTILRYCGIEPYMALGEDDFTEIAKLEGTIRLGDRVRFNPVDVRRSDVSPRIKNLMTKLMEVWSSETEATRNLPPNRCRDSGQSPPRKSSSERFHSFFIRCWVAILAHGFSPHLDAMSVVD